MEPTANRRDGVRYPAVENRILLAWTDGSGHEQMVARLVNVSQSGALLLADRTAPVRQPLWIRMDRPGQTGWSDAVVVRCTRSLRARLTGKGPCLVRLRFRPSCPYEFFRLATLGVQLGDTVNQSRTSEHEVGRWR